MMLDIKGVALVVDPDNRRENKAYPGIVYQVGDSYVAACALSNHGLRLLCTEEDEEAIAFFPLRKWAARALLDHSKQCMF